MSRLLTLVVILILALAGYGFWSGKSLEEMKAEVSAIWTKERPVAVETVEPVRPTPKPVQTAANEAPQPPLDDGEAAPAPDQPVTPVPNQSSKAASQAADAAADAAAIAADAAAEASSAAPTSAAARQAQAAAESAIAAADRAAEAAAQAATGDASRKAAAEAATAARDAAVATGIAGKAAGLASEQAKAIDHFLTVESFDQAKIAAAVDKTTLPEAQKIALKELLWVAQSNPEMLSRLLPLIKGALE